MRNTLGITLATCACLTCAGVQTGTLELVFPDEAARQQTARVILQAIAPTAGAACEPLLSDQAAPGDPQYPVEAELEITDAADPDGASFELDLTNTRIFFATAYDPSDQAILRGCSLVARAGSDSIVIALDWIAPSCTGDEDCDDGLWCSGDESCQNGHCTVMPRDCDDDDPCTQDTCDESSRQCSHALLSEPPSDEGPPGDPSCGDAADNDCDGLTDMGDPDCRTCLVDSDCEDGNPCTANTCNPSSGCQTGPAENGMDCDDGLYCTVADACRDGACFGTPRDCSEADGNCLVGTCQENSASCLPQPAPENTSCDDGWACTIADRCAADGGCRGDQDDGICQSQAPASLCLPGCFASADGCGMPPTELQLSCQSPIDLASSQASSCHLGLVGGDNIGQETCIECRVESGRLLLDETRFGDSPGVCDLNGWALVPASPDKLCTTRVSNCNPAQARYCCDRLDTICDGSSFGQNTLRSDFDLNCGGDNQWRLGKTFDLTGTTSAQVCFSLASHQLDTSSGLLLVAQDSLHPSEQVTCLLGGREASADDFLYRECVPLPTWANGSGDLTLTFIAHADTSGQALYLDWISLWAWPGDCTPARLTVLDETFSDCNADGWTVDALNTTCLVDGCSNQPGYGPGLALTGQSASLETQVDASSLDGDVQACIRFGNDANQAGDFIRLQFDAGAGWTTAWEQADTFGPMGSCREVCVPLSEIDPALNANPALALRIEVQSQGDLALYGVSLSGASGCTVQGSTLSVDPPIPDGMGGYDFQVRDTSALPIDVQVRCTWPAGGDMQTGVPVQFNL